MDALINTNINFLETIGHEAFISIFRERLQQSMWIKERTANRYQILREIMSRGKNDGDGNQIKQQPILETQPSLCI